MTDRALFRLRTSEVGGRVQKTEHERLFSFSWHPYAVFAKKDYSDETSTLVEFKLEKTATGGREGRFEFNPQPIEVSGNLSRLKAFVEE